MDLSVGFDGIRCFVRGLATAEAMPRAVVSIPLNVEVIGAGPVGWKGRSRQGPCLLVAQPRTQPQRLRVHLGRPMLYSAQRRCRLALISVSAAAVVCDHLSAGARACVIE